MGAEDELGRRIVWPHIREQEQRQQATRLGVHIGPPLRAAPPGALNVPADITGELFGREPDRHRPPDVWPRSPSPCTAALVVGRREHRRTGGYPERLPARGIYPGRRPVPGAS